MARHCNTTIPARLFAPLAAALLLVGCGQGDGSNPSGTLEVSTVDLAGTHTGAVQQVRADRGRTVASGDTLVVLDTELLQIQLRQTRAALRQLEARLEAAGERIAQARENAELARTTYRRIETLQAQGNATPQRLDEARTAMEVARRNVAAARSERTALEAERERLEATLDQQRRRIEDGTLLAPLDGMVLTRLVEPGEVLPAGGTALRLANLSRMELRIYLGVKDLDLVKVGQEVAVLVDALEGEEITGTVSWISDEAEFTPKNVQTREARAQLVYAVEVDVPNRNGRLHIGMPAEVVIPAK